jgi:DNA-binding PadR family transcriptional regulator
MANDLSLFSIEILGLVGRQGAGPHDMRRFAQRGRMLAWAGESQYYTEPKRLARLGYLAARNEPGKTRERTVYTLTDMGLEALREYAKRPVTFTPLKSDALLRMLICDLAGEDVTRESMIALRDDLADIAARLDQAEEAAHGLPHREKYLLIATRFLRRYLELHEELVDEVDRELSASATAPRSARREAAAPADRRRRTARRSSRSDDDAHGPP